MVKFRGALLDALKELENWASLNRKDDGAVDSALVLSS